ncbi:polyribonucleotide nucleotidyltransferase [Candidatus Falkowbacteria bacterium]|jgi:polyribonucleotide nucleotidyltransferase|nr:polyribonucleotide nucleotidyltransferase [Candidatus Falkowbacteria bacterium]MBT7007772.1 polyribonucleotide nucleotidyltransferase [Candidatus Falkowbacteria bacterium]
MKKQTFEMEFAGKKLIVETGELALQANASCTVRYGDTVVLATAVMNKEAREGLDFFPLMVEYEEKMYAAGKIKGSRFIKRETRPGDEAILTGRMIDRGLRPLFDQSIRRDVQVIVSVLSFDEENDADIPAIIAASTVLHISDIPWKGPLAGIRVGKVENEWIVNPTYEVREKSSLDLTLSVSEDKVLMVESSANDVDQATMYEAFELAIKEGKKIVKFIDDIRKKVGTEKQVINDEVQVEEELDENQKMSEQQLQDLEKECKEKTLSMLDKYLFNIPHGSKGERKEALKDVKVALDEFLTEKQVGKDRKKKVMKFFYPFIDEQITKAILDRDQRIDGRKLDQIRPLSAKIDLLPRTHGSGLFSRGETQVLSIVTLGSPGDEQTVDGMETNFKKSYMHHYNFPPFSVGEAKPLRGAGRRDIGHGALAEKALVPVLPSKEDFPYTIRVVSEVLGSNGSSSMGSTCGSTVALMAAGVPIKKPVAGIAIGIASNEKGDFKVLTDIQDFEDGDGGMDFKVTGTRDGVTAIQMDTKTDGLTLPLIKEALPRAMKAINEIIDVIEKEIPKPKDNLSQYAPRITALKINPDKIRSVIGAGGKTINEIIDTTGVQIDIEDDGTVMITSTNERGSEDAIEWIQNLTKEAKVGEVYEGTVVKIMDFGAFVEIFPGTDGMVHISEITDKERVEDVNKYLEEGQAVKVKVLKVDAGSGKISLSIKKV